MHRMFEYRDEDVVECISANTLEEAKAHQKKSMGEFWSESAKWREIVEPELSRLTVRDCDTDEDVCLAELRRSEGEPHTACSTEAY